MTRSEEANSIARATAGDREAITDLVRLHQDHVYRLTLSMCGAHDAEDLAQEALTRAISTLSRFRGQSSFKTWLTRIAANVCIDHLRRKRKLVELDAGLASGDPGPPEVVARRQRLAAVRAAIAELPPPQRLAVTLVHIQEMSHAETAQIMNITPRSLEGRLYRARRTLARKLEQLLEE